MSTKIVQFVNFWIKHKFIFLLSFLTICLVLTFGVLKLNVNQSIYAILPQGNSFQAFNQLVKSKNINNKIFFQLELNEELEEIEILSFLESVKDSLDNNFEDFLKDVTFQKENLDEKVYNYYYENFPVLIDSTYYSQINFKIHPDTISKSVEAGYRNMISPSGAFLRKFILNDPLFISSSFFKSIENSHSQEQMKIENGLIYAKDNKSVFIYATIRNDNLKGNEILYEELKKLKKQWNKLHVGNQLDFFGPFQISVENSIQVKKDTITTIAITIIAILIILFGFYRKLLIPLFFILPTIFGGLFALGIIGYVKPDISGLSLATGAILFGVILDYSFHFFTHLEHTRSIEQTIKEIAAPLLSGGVTTILAFAALILANSVILQDFGLFASLSLAGASLFTLLALPVFLSIFSFEFKGPKKEDVEIEQKTISKKTYPLVLLAVIVLTIFMYFKSSDVEFDKDIANLSYHEESLKLKEDKFVGINPSNEQKIYLFSKGDDNEKTLEINYRLINTINKLIADSLVNKQLSTGDFLVPKSIKGKRRKSWEEYWSKNAKSTFLLLDSLSDNIGYSPGVFNNFKKWVENYDDFDSAIDTNFLKQLELNNLIDYNEENELTLLSTIVVNHENIEKVKGVISKLKGVTVFNRKDMATSLVDIVKDDFNYLLFVSGLIVFITLLLIYGRIELALLAFLPMVISWIWILGFAAILDIKFNFVNIIITTFIFGLGDDFSIFVTDGLLAKYKYGKNSFKSFRTAIILSAVTTIIGTGVLYFAKHPAIHSVAVLSVLGILCILFISLIVQPFIFKFFIQNRVDSGKPPITLFSFVSSIYLFVLFLLGCLFSILFLLVITILPISKLKKRDAINFVLSKFAWVNIYAGIFYSKEIINKTNLDTDNPSIIIANHTSFTDILLMIMLNPKIVIVVKEWVYKSNIFGPLVRKAGYIYVDDGAENNLIKAKELVENGYSIMIFPEGSRTEIGKLKRFHKGAFYLAQELGVDITPIIIHGAAYLLPKNDFLFNNGKLTLKVLPRIKHSDISWGENYKSRTKSISSYFKKEYQELKDEKENAKYFKNVIFQNYVFKSPFLEWYFKIKWNFEAENFDYYNSLIGNKKSVLDVGCGYGYFSYFLHYKNRERDIIALDYDEEKIELAQNAFNMNNNLKFASVDITEFEFPKRDVIFYNDVLHYLSEKEQLSILDKSVKALNEKGMLIIRDGITDLEGRHQKTLKTENYSTNIIGFNKKTRDFNFFSSKFIADFALDNNLSYEMKEQSEKTSNVLFVLKKK